MGPVILRPFLNSIGDPQLRDQFLEDVVTEAAADPGFELDYWRLNLRGTRR
jgi:hypothetical protein